MSGTSLRVQPPQRVGPGLKWVVQKLNVVTFPRATQFIHSPVISCRFLSVVYKVRNLTFKWYFSNSAPQKDAIGSASGPFTGSLHRFPARKLLTDRLDEYRVALLSLLLRYRLQRVATALFARPEIPTANQIWKQLEHVHPSVGTCWHSTSLNSADDRLTDSIM